MVRRKSALIFLLFFLTVLVLSPWVSAPTPAVPKPPEQSKSTAQTVQPVTEQEPVHLRVAVSMDQDEFDYLVKQNEEQSFRFPDITVELERADPDHSFSLFSTASRMGVAADVMLVENEWVKSYAASGYLLPADSAFMGEAMSDQFDAISAPLKWNDYIWGVPRDFDPYVLVWNLPVLRSLLGDTASPPSNPAGWTELAAKSREGGTAVRWLSIDRRDPVALLSWVQSVSGQRTDTIWSDGGNPWSGTPQGTAMTILDRERTGVFYAGTLEEISESLVSGSSAAAVLPYSKAEKLASEKSGAEKALYIIDRSAWKSSYTWPRGRSFTLSSRTKVEDAARRWIALMTETFVQQDNRETFGKLPVYRSMYRNGNTLSPLFEGNVTSAFPYMPPADFGPELPIRLLRLADLWGEWASGKARMEEWIRRWPETSADFELNR